MEAIRKHLGISSWHVLSHSWGGLLAQAYTAWHPDRVSSLVLSSSSLGVGADWKLTKRVAFRTSRQRAGLWGTVRLYCYGSGLGAPGSVRNRAMRHVMTETWHNYFLDPRRAPDPDEHWLGGCSADAMIRTDRAVSREDPAVLTGLGIRRSRDGPVRRARHFRHVSRRRPAPPSAGTPAHTPGFRAPALAAERSGLPPGSAPFLLRATGSPSSEYPAGLPARKLADRAVALSDGRQ